MKIFKKKNAASLVLLPVMFEDDTNIHLHAEDLHTSQNKTA